MKKIDPLAILIIFLSLPLLFYQINKPFWGQFDWTGAWFGTIARNYLQIDISKTKLAPITVAGTSDPTLWSYYNHYPVTYPLIIAGSLAVFGDHEWAIRLVPIIFSVLMLGVFYLLCRRFFHPLVGVFGILSILVTPMFIYYGKLPVHEQPVLFLSLLAVYFYLAKRFRLMTLFVASSFAVSWTGAYILLLISTHAFFTQRKMLIKFLPAYLILGAIAVLHLAHIAVSSDFKDFGNAVAERTMSGGSPIAFVIKQARWFLALYTKPLALISLLGLIFWRKPLLLMFFVWGFFQWLVVNRIMWIHDYMLIYFLPFVALSSGIFFHKLWDKNKIVCIVSLVVILSLSLYTSLPFTKALLNSKDQTAEVYPVATYLRSHSKYGDKILVAIPAGSDFEVHFPSHYFSYYTDRYVQYGTNPDQNGGFKYVVSWDYTLENHKLVKNFGQFHLYEN